MTLLHLEILEKFFKFEKCPNVIKSQCNKVKIMQLKNIGEKGEGNKKSNKATIVVNKYISTVRKNETCYELIIKLLSK